MSHLLITKEALVLRTCNSDRTSYGGFQWPESGYVAAPDWDPKPICGGGLHGLLWGEGMSGYLDLSDTALWQVVRIDELSAVWIAGDKVKFPHGEVIYTGDHSGAIALTGGDCSTLTGGDRSTLTGGYRSTLVFKRWNGKRYKVVVAEIGEGDYKPNVRYRLNDKFQVIAVDQEAN